MTRTTLQQGLAEARRLAGAGQLAAAERQLQALVERYPGNARARDRLADLARDRARHAVPPDRLARLQQLVDAGRLADAVEEARQLAAFWPDPPEAHHALAALLLAAGDPDAAAASAAHALRRDPDHAAASTLLGRALLQLDRPADAATCFLDALRTRPDLAAAHRGLGRALFALGDPAAAARSLARATRFVPDDPALALAHAEALAATDEAEDALDAFDRALALAPDDADVMNRRAIHLKNMGRLEQAEAGFAAATRARPDHAAAWANFARLHRFRPGDPSLDALDRLIAADGPSDRDRAHLHFAAAKAREDAGDPDAAVHHYARGNALRRAALPATEGDDDATQFARLRRAFSKPLPPPLGAGPGAAPRPVFILGMPRSGTTLCEQILAGHPQVTPLGEPDFLAPAVNAAAIGEGPVTTVQLEAIRTRYRAALGRAAPGAAVVTDKMPFNFRLAGHILLALPEAAVIHMRRDPRATCWSNYRTDFEEDGPSLAWAWDLGDIVAYHRLHDALMAFWHERFPGRIHEVCYEALTEEPEPAARALLAHAGLPWDPACLDTATPGRLVRTASDTQVRRPIFTGSSDGWRRHAAHLGPITDAWGTGPDPQPP